ncbi:hemerythrin domain-containing protein [Ruminiclostridium cellulolyticum]|uniref:Hemerythrin HHE cation binding domain protein n=1 Tax=Ruminiclostridium cellulolyticum (strain ATCC 35319 / DSM 5812 / JCM 6584 / H10) TaxID=394503 RepID=B8I658_RUMCH|nr:hemerythrin domain-containing protein [Ruminiclostridium cellulolyticum]ACL76823.1 Hemerythrin HHE cation binding domain protein [Ruminiclostridium cellulolyticum H10]
MDCIDLMIDEHKNIKRMLKVIRAYCYKILKGEKVKYEDLFTIIDFVRNYSDAHHHGKEEKLLFDRMEKEMGPAAQKLIRHGMLVEHDLGRLHMQELEAAVKRVMEGDDESRLDIIANAVSYTHLLYRHIEKEDGVVYKFARNNLTKETMEILNQKCEKAEKEALEQHLQEKYLKLIEEFEKKVL